MRIAEMHWYASWHKRSEKVVINRVEVLAEARVLFFELLAVVPLLERLVNIVLANLKHRFGISASRFLQAPGRRVVKADTAGTGARILLLEVVTSLETGIGRSLAVE